MTPISEVIKANQPIGRIPVTLDGQLAVVLRMHFANEIPANKKRERRNGDFMPLSSWMRGAKHGATSKIKSVTDGTARYPYRTNKASSEVLMDRIAKRHQITMVQTSLLAGYINRRYPGQIDLSGMSVAIGMFGESRWGEAPSRSAINSIEFACQKIKKPIHLIPLRAILDPNITNILLLMQLNEVIHCAKKHNPFHIKRTTK